MIGKRKVQVLVTLYIPADSDIKDKDARWDVEMAIKSGRTLDAIARDRHGRCYSSIPEVRIYKPKGDGR